MTNLKHLEIHVKARCDASLLGWVSLIEASPVLEKLSVKFSGRSRRHGKHRRIIDKCKVEPFKSLKILELIYFVGLPIEMEFATFVVLNSVCLKEVIRVVSRSSYMNVPIKFRRRIRDLIKEFQSTLPPGAVFRTNICDTLEQEIIYT
ncbi:unnamed protein product [Amaranthus hypochondriacus]